jgi:putative cell wall-binding protein
VLPALLATTTFAGTVAGVGLVATGGAAVAAQPASAVPSNVTRVSGATRIDTAVAASQDQFPTAASAQAVVLARADNFPDALAGGPFAAKVGGPLLLTSSKALDDSVKAEIQRVAPKGATVYILGGTAAIATGVDTTISGIGDVPKRVFGNDRFATAVAIADAMGDPSTVFEATGLNFPDALAGVPAAIKTGGVILLTNGAQQAPATAAYLTAHAGGTHYALGGPAATADTTATPLVGDDRFWTATGVAQQFFPDATTIGVATGLNFPDALAAGPDLAAHGAPLLLAPSTGGLAVAPTVYLLWTSHVTTKAVLFGGPASVSDDMATQIGDLVGGLARAQALDATPAYTGGFGTITLRTKIAGLTGNETVVVDASTGDGTSYSQGGPTTTLAGAETPRAQLAALPLDHDAFVAAVNALYADLDAQSGFDTQDPDMLYLLNVEQILLNPVAPASVRFEAYAALAADNGATLVNSGVKDSLGRVGIEIYAPMGADDSDQSKVSFIFDPVTLLPLEDTVVDADGSVLTRSTVMGLTTSVTAPGNPYTS